MQISRNIFIRVLLLHLVLNKKATWMHISKWVLKQFVVFEGRDIHLFKGR